MNEVVIFAQTGKVVARLLTDQLNGLATAHGSPSSGSSRGPCALCRSAGHKHVADQAQTAYPPGLQGGLL